MNAYKVEISYWKIGTKHYKDLIVLAESEIQASEIANTIEITTAIESTRLLGEVYQLPLK